MVPEFPRRLLRERQHAWNLLGTAATPGQTAQPFASNIRSDGGGFWSCTMTDISLGAAAGLSGKDRPKITTLLWRAVRQIADGGINAIVVPRNDALFRPWPRGISQTAGFPVLHSDGAPFDDGAGYYQPVIDIATAADASLRARSLSIVLNLSGDLQGGESFSILHPTWGWRLYEISTVTMTSPTAAAIRFNPGLREDVAAGTRLEFDRPRCLMALAKTGSMDLTVKPWTFNDASVDFVETAPS